MLERLHIWFGHLFVPEICGQYDGEIQYLVWTSLYPSDMQTNDSEIPGLLWTSLCHRDKQTMWQWDSRFGLDISFSQRYVDNIMVKFHIWFGHLFVPEKWTIQRVVHWGSSMSASFPCVLPLSCLCPRQCQGLWAARCVGDHATCLFNFFCHTWPI